MPLLLQSFLGIYYVNVHKQMFQHPFFSVSAIKHYAKVINTPNNIRVTRRHKDSLNERDEEYLKAAQTIPSHLTDRDRKLHCHRLWLRFFFPWVRKTIHVHPPVQKLMYVERLPVPKELKKLIGTYLYKQKTLMYVPYEYSKKSLIHELDGFNINSHSILRYTKNMPFIPFVYKRNPYQMMQRKLELHLRMKLLYVRNIEPFNNRGIEERLFGPLNRYDMWSVNFDWQTMILVDMKHISK